MKKITSLAGRELKWIQPGAWRPHFELRVGGEIAATLHFESSFSGFAVAESEDGCWTFKRSGFFRKRVAIVDRNSGKEIASYREGNWGRGGTLSMPGGKSLHGTSDFWMRNFRFNGESPEPLLEFKNSGVFHHSAIVHMSPSAADMPELPWMVMLAWYLIMVMKRDSEAVAAAAAG